MTYTPTMPFNQYLAIDPLALVLPGEIYAQIAEIRHPHVPKVNEVKKLLTEMSVEERTFVNKKITELKGIVEVFEEANKAIK